MPAFGKREGTIYSKVMQVQSNGGMSLLNPTPFRNKDTPTNTHTVRPPLAKPGQSGVLQLRKRNRSLQLGQTLVLNAKLHSLGGWVGVLLHSFKPLRKRALHGCYILLSCFLSHVVKTALAPLPKLQLKPPHGCPPGFKFWQGYSSVTPFLTPPTTGYACWDSRVLCLSWLPQLVLASVTLWHAVNHLQALPQVL